MRIEKLRALVDAYNGPAEFSRRRSVHSADKTIDASYVSQILNKHRSFGEKAALNMARRAGLPDDYFDKQDIEQSFNLPPTTVEADRVQTVLKLLAEAELSELESVEKIVSAMISLKNPAAPPNKTHGNAA